MPAWLRNNEIDSKQVLYAYCYDIPQHEVIHILVPEAPGLADRQPFGNISPTIRYLYPREHLQGRSLVKGTQSLVLISLPLSILGCISFLFWIMRMYIKLSNEEDILRSSRNSVDMCVRKPQKPRTEVVNAHVR
jgi:hypothetical protein